MALSRTSTLNEERRRSLVSLRASSIEVNSLSRQLVSTDTTSISLVALFFVLFCLVFFVVVFVLFVCLCFVCLCFVLAKSDVMNVMNSFFKERVRFIHSTATLSHQVETKEMIFLLCLRGKPVQPYK